MALSWLVGHGVESELVPVALLKDDCGDLTLVSNLLLLLCSDVVSPLLAVHLRCQSSCIA